jgi:hypothetical protein
VVEQFGDGACTGRLRAGRQVEDAIAGDKGGDRPAVSQVGPGQGPGSGVIDQAHVRIRQAGSLQRNNQDIFTL